MSSNGKTQKITGLSIRDFLIIKEADLQPDSKMNVFVGKNRQGKTSVLKAIETAINGTDDISVIRHGAEQAEIILDLNGLQIHRTIKAKGTHRLKVIEEVTTSTGDKKKILMPAPQTYLKGLLGDFSFDPIAFIVLDSKERTKYLRELFKTKITPDMLDFVPEKYRDGLDYAQDGSEIISFLSNNKNGLIYRDRADLNKQVDQKKALFEAKMSSLSGFEPTTYQDKRENIKGEIKAAEDRLNDAKTLKRQAEGNEKIIQRERQKIEDTQKELALLDKSEIERMPTYEAEMKALSDEIEALEVQLNQKRALLKEKYETLQTARQIQMRETELNQAIKDAEGTIALVEIKDIPKIDAIESELDTLQMQLVKADADAAAMQTYQEALTIQKEYEDLKAQSDDLTDIIKKLNKDLTDHITKEANIPIADLKFEGDKIMIGNRSLDNMSTSEQVGVALSIVRAMNKDAKLKLLCLDRAESLDDETLAAFREQIKEDEFQYFITQVQHGNDIPAGAMVVEDGTVRQEAAA